jgi:hypothetical protein
MRSVCASRELTSRINSIPNAYPDGESGDVRIKVISGKSFGVESPVRPLGERHLGLHVRMTKG